MAQKPQDLTFLYEAYVKLYNVLAIQIIQNPYAQSALLLGSE
jgi:hypothetical protein